MHDYLGMHLYYGTKVKLRITMHKYINSIVEAAAEDIDSIAKTPAANHMFTVRGYGDTLIGT